MPQNQNYLGNPNTDLNKWVGTVPASIRTSTEDYVTTTHTACVVTIPAPPPGWSNVIGGVAWSYTGGTATGSLTIADGSGNTVLSLDCVSSTTQSAVYFDPPRCFSNNTITTITLADGGAGATGKLNILGRYTTQVPIELTPYTSGGLDFEEPGNSQYIPIMAI